MLKFKSDYKICTYLLFHNNQNCLDTKVRSYPLHILVFQCSDCHCHSLLRLFCKDWCLNSTSRSFHMLKMNYSVGTVKQAIFWCILPRNHVLFYTSVHKLAMYVVNYAINWDYDSMEVCTKKQHQWLSSIYIHCKFLLPRS